MFFPTCVSKPELDRKCKVPNTCVWRQIHKRRVETDSQKYAIHDTVHSRENLLGQVADHPRRQWMPKQVDPRQYVPQTPDILIPIHLHSRGHKRKAMRPYLNSTGEMELIKRSGFIHAHFVWVCVHRWGSYHNIVERFERGLACDTRRNA